MKAIPTAATGAARRTPFLDMDGAAHNGASHDGTTATTPPRSSTTRFDSPFLSQYEVNGAAETVDPRAEAFVRLASEMHDEAFDDAVFELVNEAVALREERFAAVPGARAADAERLLREHFMPLVSASETMLARMSEQLAPVDLRTVEETELEAMLDAYLPPEAGLSPGFENFFGKLVKKVKTVARKAASLAKRGVQAAARLGLGPILDRLKGIVRPMLQRVLQAALNRLPAQYRPLAQRLAQRLPLLKEVEEEAAGQTGEDAVQDVAEIQHEFDVAVSEMLLAESEHEQRMVQAEYAAGARATVETPVLEEARAHFAEGLASLREREDPAPHVEAFIPALLPALKLGVKLAGRQRVVDFLSGLVSNLIRPFVGTQHAAGLSRALVDAGLRLVQLETEEEDASRASGAAVAATVEDTVRQVASLPGHVFDDEALLEGYVVQAFERAAAANLPAVLRPEVYEQRPDLRETSGHEGAWVWAPMRSPVYKKYTRVYETTITPHAAREIRTYGGAPLAAFLTDRLGLPPGRSVRARVHLYEAIPGTLLPQISRMERDVPGLGSTAATAYMKLHPLTPTAAALLVSQPGLGRTVPPRYLAQRRTPQIGQRFYYLEIPGAHPQVMVLPDRHEVVRRSGEVSLTLDLPERRIRAAVFLSERDAQHVATRLRAQAPSGAVLPLLGARLQTGLHALLAGEGGLLRFVHASVPPGSTHRFLRHLPPHLVDELSAQTTAWADQALSAAFRNDPHAFVAAAEHPSDGVTVVVAIEQVPGFTTLDGALRSGAVPLAGRLFDGQPRLSVQFEPGYSRD